MIEWFQGGFMKERLKKLEKLKWLKLLEVSAMCDLNWRQLYVKEMVIARY